MIEIKNLRHSKPSEPYDIKVDRSSILGNPFYMKNESQRDDVCNKYQIYFNKQFNYCIENDVQFSKLFIQELQRLVKIYKLYNKLRLFCWCTPKRCHAETIKNYILDNFI